MATTYSDVDKFTGYYPEKHAQFTQNSLQKKPRLQNICVSVWLFDANQALPWSSPI